MARTVASDISRLRPALPPLSLAESFDRASAENLVSIFSLSLAPAPILNGPSSTASRAAPANCALGAGSGAAGAGLSEAVTSISPLGRFRTETITALSPSARCAFAFAASRSEAMNFIIGELAPAGLLGPSGPKNTSPQHSPKERSVPRPRKGGNRALRAKMKKNPPG